MTYDSTMLGAAKVYARANQALIITPFILAGAMSPVTVAGTVAQTLAEALAGLAFVQLVNPGAPVVLGSFASSISMQSGAPTFGTPEPALGALLHGGARAPSRNSVPLRRQSVRLEDPGCPGGLRIGQHAAAHLPRGRQFRAAHGRLARGRLAMGYEKFVMDADQAGMMHTLLAGVDLSPNGQALDAMREVGPGKHFLGCAHTQANFENAFYRSPLADNNSYEQWEAEGATEHGEARQCDCGRSSSRNMCRRRWIPPSTRRCSTT
jgi:trimethylamine--corrinoid protein Co-methyltransferase